MVGYTQNAAGIRPDICETQFRNRCRAIALPGFGAGPVPLLNIYIFK